MPPVLRYWVPFIVYLGFLTYLLFKPSLPEISMPYFDKAAHLGFFAVLGILVLRIFHPIEQHWSLTKCIKVALLETLIYGMITELGQAMTATRSAEWGDLFMDGLGGAIGGFCYYPIKVRCCHSEPFGSAQGRLREESSEISL